MCGERMESTDLWQAQAGSGDIAGGVSRFPDQTDLAPRRVDRAWFTDLILGPVRMFQVSPASADANDTVLACDVIRMQVPVRVAVDGASVRVAVAGASVRVAVAGARVRVTVGTDVRVAVAVGGSAVVVGVGEVPRLFWIG